MISSQTSSDGGVFSAAVSKTLENALAQKTKDGNCPELWENLLNAANSDRTQLSNAIVHFSAGILDKLPKLFVQKSSNYLAENLRDKMSKHNALLECLGGTGCLFESRLNISAVRAIFENQEKLYALQSVSQINGARCSKETLERVYSIFHLAGAASRSECEAEQRYTDWDLCFARPSVSVYNIMKAISHKCQLQENFGASGNAKEQVAHFKDLWALLGQLIEAGKQHRNDLKAKFPNTSTMIGRQRTASWLSGPEARAAWTSLVEVGVKVHDRFVNLGEDYVHDFRNIISMCLQHLLTACHAQLQLALPNTVKQEINAEYRDACNRFLGWMINEAQKLVGARKRSTREAGENLITWCECHAREHHAYKQLFQMYEFMNNPQEMYNTMRSLKPQKAVEIFEGFALWVFKHLHSENRIGELLSLPSDFDNELVDYLEAVPDLLYIVQIRNGDLAGACQTAISLGQTRQNLREARYAMSIASLLTRAGVNTAEDRAQDLDCELEYDLKCLQTQDAIGMPGPLQSVEIILNTVLQQAERCHDRVRQEQLVKKAADILALQTKEFIQCHRTMWDEFLMCALKLTEWEELSAIDALSSDYLKTIPLYKHLATVNSNNVLDEMYMAACFRELLDPDTLVFDYADKILDVIFHGEVSMECE